MRLGVSKLAIKTELQIRNKMRILRDDSCKNEHSCIKNSCFYAKKSVFSCVIQLFVVPLQSEMVK